MTSITLNEQCKKAIIIGEKRFCAKAVHRKELFMDTEEKIELTGQTVEQKVDNTKPVDPVNPEVHVNPVNPVKKLRLLDGLKNLGQRIIGVFRDYPVTMISIVIAALIGAILIEWNDNASEIYLERAAVFCLILALQTLLFEEIFPQKKVVRFAGYGVSALISAVFVYILSSQGESLFGMTGDTRDFFCEMTARVLFVYGAAFIGISIHHMFKRLEEDFEVYAARAFLELVKSTVIYGLFALGLAAIIWIFNELIFDTDDFLSQVELFLAGGIYVPMCLKAISGKNEEPGKFARVCFLYVLQPMLLVAFAIIYLYIFKIFITNDIPSNRIFNILAFLFAIGMPVWTVVHGMEQKKSILQRIIVFIPYVFIPFVLLQCWSIGVRIAGYGVTSSRYLACTLVFCEVVYFALYLWHRKGRKGAIADILYVLIAVAFFVVLCPGTEIDDVVIHSQMSRLTTMLEEDNADTSSVKSAYRAINYSGFKGKRTLKEKLTPDQIAKIEAMDEYIIDNDVYVHGTADISNLDITPYKKIYEAYYDREDGIGKVTIRVKSNYDDTIDVDMSSYLMQIMNTHKKGSYYDFNLEDDPLIHINDSLDLYITYLSIDYNENTYELRSISLDGYVLEK